MDERSSFKTILLTDQNPYESIFEEKNQHNATKLIEENEIRELFNQLISAYSSNDISDIINILQSIVTEIHSAKKILQDTFDNTSIPEIFMNLFQEVDNSELFLNAMNTITAICETYPNNLIDNLLSRDLLNYTFSIFPILTEEAIPYFLRLLSALSLFGPTFRETILENWNETFFSGLFSSDSFSLVSNQHLILEQATFFFSSITQDIDSFDFQQHQSFVQWIISLLVKYFTNIAQKDQNNDIFSTPKMTYFFMQTLSNLLLSDKTDDLQLIQLVCGTEIPSILPKFLHQYLTSLPDIIPYVLNCLENISFIQNIIEPLSLVPLINNEISPNISTNACRLLIRTMEITNDCSLFEDEKIRNDFLDLIDNSSFLLKTYIVKIFLLLFKYSEGQNLIDYLEIGYFKSICDFFLQIDKDQSQILECIQNLLLQGLKDYIIPYLTEEVQELLLSFAAGDTGEDQNIVSIAQSIISELSS